MSRFIVSTPFRICLMFCEFSYVFATTVSIGKTCFSLPYFLSQEYTSLFLRFWYLFLYRYKAVRLKEVTNFSGTERVLRREKGEGN
jgi:hypothetical protein